MLSSRLYLQTPLYLFLSFRDDWDHFICLLPPSLKWVSSYAIYINGKVYYDPEVTKVGHIHDCALDICAKNPFLSLMALPFITNTVRKRDLDDITKIVKWRWDAHNQYEWSNTT